jgi:hypothetical protein
MTKPPQHAPIIDDPRKPFIDLRDALDSYAKALSDAIEKQPDKSSPKWNGIRDDIDRINADADKISKIILSSIQQDLKDNLEKLTTEIKEAQTTLKKIQKAVLMANIAAAIVTAAAAVATGGPVGAIPSLVGLIDAVAKAIEASKPDKKDGDEEEKEGK